MLQRHESRVRVSPDRWLTAGLLLAALGRAATLATDCGAQEPARGEPAPFAASEISIGEPIVAPIVEPRPAVESAAAPAAGTVDSGAAVRAGTGWLGFSVKEAGVPGRWAITDVAAGGPAAFQGIRDGDELRALNGTNLTSFDDVTQGITSIAAGDRVRIAVARGEEVRDLTVVAVPRPASPPAARFWRDSPRTADVVASPAAPFATPTQAIPAVPTPAATAAPPPTATAAPTPAAATAPTGWPQPLPSPTPATAAPATVPAPAAPAGGTPRGRTALGVRTVPIDAALQSRFRLDEPAGAYVIGVVGDLPASKAGIPPGSVIVSFAERPVRSPADLTQLVTTGPVDRAVSLAYVLPDGSRKQADVVLQSLERSLEQALVGEATPQPTPAPQLEPMRAHRTVRRMPAESNEAGAVRREIGRLRSALDALERRLERLSAGR